MRYILFFVIIFFSTTIMGYSQGVNSKLTVDGVRITVTSNDTLYVNGNVHAKENNNHGYNIHNEGNLIITDTLFSDVNSLFLSSSNKKLAGSSSGKKAYGVVTFKGPGPKHISGDSIFFAGLRVEGSTLTLDTNIFVLGSITLDHDNQSNVYLNGNDIQLYNLESDINMNTGLIGSSGNSGRSETNNSRIYDDSTGMIKAYKNEQTMPANLGFFINDTNYGNIFLYRFHTPEKNVTKGSMAEGYIIKEAPGNHSTHIGESTQMEIHYLDSNLTRRMLEDTAELGIFQNSFSDNNLTYYKHIKGNHDKANKRIRANGSFTTGRYTIAETNCDNPPSIDIPADTIVCLDKDENSFSYTHGINQNNQIVEYTWEYTWNDTILQQSEKTFTLSENSLKNKINETIEVSLKTTDSTGCVSKDTMDITIRPEPELHVDYSTSLETPGICAYDTVYFYDTSENKENMLWEMADDFGTSSTKDTLKIAFDQSFAHNTGERTIKKVTKTSQYGCKTDTALSLKVFPVPEVKFDPECPSCAGTPFKLENTTTLNTSAIKSAAVDSFVWSMDNGDTITVTDSFHSPSNAAWYQTDTIRESDRSPDLLYSTSDAGELNINLYAETRNGCFSDKTIKVSIHDSVEADIKTLSGGPYCSSDTIQFAAGSQSSESAKVEEYKWIFPDDTISTGQKDEVVHYIPSLTGEIDVKLVVDGKTGCKDTSEIQISVYEIPEADFSVKEQVCYGDTSLFEVNDINSTDTLTWEMGGATFTTNTNEKAKYAFHKPGEKDVKLTVTNKHGCKTVRRDSTFIGAIPQASFETFDKCLNAQNSDTIILNKSNNEGLSEYAINTDYSWDFGEGSESSGKQPVKQFKEPGQYNVTLTSVTKYFYKDSLSCENTNNKDIRIFPVAQANVSVNSDEICQNEKINLNAQTNLPDSTDHYIWNLGDTTINDYGNNSLRYNFQDIGKSNISLTAITNNDCRDTATKSLTVHSAPRASFESDSVCFNETIGLEAKTGDNPGDCSYEWNINNDSLIFTNPAISYQSQNTGKQNIILSVKSGLGCESTDTGHVIVNELPGNNLLPDTLSKCDDEVTLNAYSPGCFYSWSNGSTDHQITVQEDGEYSVNVVDSLTGCSSSSSVYADLNSKLNIDLPPDTAACGGIKLDAGYFGENVNYKWNTGSTDRILNVTESGNYSVEVSSDNCTASANVQVTVYEQPEPDFSSTYFETCVSDSIHIDAEIPEGDSYLWTNLDNGRTFAGKQRIFTSNTPGTEKYRITITTDNNCSASENLTFQFREKPSVELVADTSTCQNDYLLLDATSPTAVSYHWSTGETESSISPNVTSNAQETKSYAVQVENEYGCKARDSVNVTFYPVPEIFLPEQISACENETVTLNASTPFAAEYKWNTGETDSSIQITENDIIMGNSAPFYVTATSEQNCSAVSNKAYVEFIDIPEPVLPDSIEGCNEVTLNAGNYGANFNWSNGSREQTITVYETGRYTVDIQNSNGCSISDTVHVTVNHVTKPYLGEDMAICKNEEITLRTGIHDEQYSFEWNGYSTGDTMVVSSAGTYWVKAINENGCTASDTIQVAEKESPEVDLGEDTYMCNEDHIILDAGDDGLFYEWGSSRDTSAYSSTLEVSDTGGYWVSVESGDGCVTNDTINIKHTNHTIEADFITHSQPISGDSVKFIDMSHPTPTNWLWEFGDYTSSVLQDPVHVYYGKGSYRVVQHVSNGYCSATNAKIIEVKQPEKVTDSTEATGELSDGEYIDIADVSIYPNPNTGRFTIKGDLTTRADLNIYVFDLMGKLTTIKKMDDVKTFNRTIHIEHLPDGIYIVKLLAGTNHKTYKIIKQ